MVVANKAGGTTGLICYNHEYGKLSGQWGNGFGKQQETTDITVFGGYRPSHATSRMVSSLSPDRGVASAPSAPAPSRQGAGSRSPACSSAGSPRPDPAEEELVGLHG